MEKPSDIETKTVLIQQKLKKVYKELPKKGKEQSNEWSVLAAIISYDKELKECEILTMGTGSKCVTAKQHNDDIINDSHAEVICKRSFQLFLLGQVEKAEYIEKTIPKEGENEKWKWKSNKYELIFYISQVPCGDCCISGKEKSIEENIETGAKRFLNNSIDETIALWEEKDLKDGIGKTRIKPGKGEKSLSMSCSDKILKWEILGLQGGLLSNYFEPITFNLVIIEKPGDEDAVVRGINTRAVRINSVFLDKKLKVAIPSLVTLVESTGIVKHSNGKLSSAGSSINYVKGMKEEVTLGVRGVKFGAGKKVVESHRSRLCAANLNKRYMETFKISAEELQRDKEYETRKGIFKTNVEGGWTNKIKSERKDNQEEK